MEDDSFWDGLSSLVGRDPEVVHGSPVMKKMDENGTVRLTRLPANALVENVECFMELSGMSQDEAIEATIEQFPSTPGGAESIRALLAYQAAHLPQLQS
jgi:hypothetical protein